MKRLAVAAAALLVACVAVLMPVAIAPRPGAGRPGEPSIERAFADVTTLASAPRPAGSLAHDAARSYLLAELARAGWDTRVEELTVAGQRPGGFERGHAARAARVRNVVARRRGTAAGAPSVAAVAHYDSVSASPGAADDGYGVAALLETARVLGEGPTLVRDVILVFTDAEEPGLLGANAFASQDPWRDSIGVVLNFEARGNAGPALLFETSGPDLALLRAVPSEAVPMGNSLARGVSERMQNMTDFSEWRARGVPGLNFANIGGYARYHAPEDTAENASRATLAHHAALACGTVRNLAQTPRDATFGGSGASATYFDLGRLAFVTYPASWSPWISLAGAALLLGWVALLVRRDRHALPAFALAATGQLGALVSGTAASVALVMLLGTRVGAMGPSPRVGVVASYLIGFVALGVTAVALGARSWFRRIGSPELVPARAAGGAAVWVLATVALHAWLPSGAYLFAWPLVGAALAGALATRVGHPRIALALSVAGFLPGWLLIPEHAFHLAQAFLVGSGPAITALTILFLAPQASLVALSTPRGRAWSLPAAGAAAAIAAISVASISDLHDADHPRTASLFAVVDVDRGEARWVTPDLPWDPPPPWVADRVGDRRSPLAELFPLDSARSFFVSDPDPKLASAAHALAPEASLIEVAAVPPTGRRLRIRLAHSDALMLAVHADPEAGVQAATLDGASVPLTEAGGLYVQWYGPPRAGELVLDVSGAAAGSVALRVVAQYVGWPPGITVERAPGEGPRPSMVAEPFHHLMESDKTLAVRAFAF